MTSKELIVYDYVVDWVKKNTDYRAFKGDDSDSRIGGLAMDWFFNEFHLPSFMFEVYTSEYGSDPYSAARNHQNLVYWMKTTLPFFMYLLVNIENLHNWKTPDNQPPLMEIA
jgi:hypothetical protein